VRILVSGVTREQANARVNKPKFSMIQGMPAIVRSLKNLGHEIDHRQVVLGEDLNGRYDAAVIGLSPTNSFPANKCGLGALWAIGALDCPTIIYWEDWQYRATLSGLRRLMRNPQDLDKKTSKGEWFYQDDRDLVAKHGSRLVETAAGLLQPWRRLYGVVPSYEWGDLSIPQGDLPSGARTGRIDLAPEAMLHIMPAYDRIVEQLQQPKEVQWTCASLVDHDNWIEKQKLQWPVQLFGRRRGEHVRLDTEGDVAVEIARSAGSLCPKYHHAGSGWWRARFISAALGRTVLGADPKEAGLSPLGQPYSYTPAQVEQFTPQQRVDLAVAQQEALWPWLWSQERFDFEMDQHLKKAATW
jgi:hypothetical protein